MAVRMFNNRDPAIDDQEFDAIIIGAGPSGMTTASLLGKYGNFRTLILEAHDEVAGGTMHSFGCGGIQFCSGVHYISVNGSASLALWSDLTNGQELIHDKEGTVDTLWVKGKPYSWSPQTFEATYGIKKSSIYRLSGAFMWVILVKVLWYPFAVLAWAYFTYLGPRKEAEMDWADWCKKETGKKEIDPVWFTQSGDWGAVARAKNPGMSCAMLAGAVTKHYMNGVTKVKGGYPETVRRMTNVVKDRNGTILIDAKVDEILFDKTTGAATGVSCKGVNFKSKRVIVSGAHALQKLTGKKCPASIVSAINQIGESVKHGVVFLAYKGKKAADLGLCKGNHWIEEDYFLSWKESDAGLGVYILWEMDYLKRGGDYLEKKDELAEKAKEFIFKMFPKLAEYDDEDAATPATTEKYLQGFKGASYGLDTKTKRWFDFDIVRALRPETELPGVYLTGQDTVCVGISGALSAGVVTTQTILYPSLIDVFFRGKEIYSMLVKEYKKKNKTVTDNDKKSQ